MLDYGWQSRSKRDANCDSAPRGQRGARRKHGVTEQRAQSRTHRRPTRELRRANTVARASARKPRRPSSDAQTAARELRRANTVPRASTPELDTQTPTPELPMAELD